MKPGTKDTTIPRRSMLWIAAALVFTMPPMFGNLVWWVPVSFLIALAAKFRMELRGWRLRSVALQALMSAAVLGCIELTYHSLIGLEPGLSISLLLIAIKILESHTARDFHMLAILGWFLCLTELFISQTLAAVLYALAGFLLVSVAVVQFHRGVATRRTIFEPLRAGAGLVAQSLPFVLVLFFLFPRGNGGFRFDLKRAFFGRTGMSDSLTPGSVASLALSKEVAFRAEFPDGNIPPPGNMYWRAAVLTIDRGLAWSPEPPGNYRPMGEHLGGAPVRQRIVIQPHGAQWVFALDWPGLGPRGTRLVAGNVLRSRDVIYSPRRYSVTSYPNNKESELWPQELNACLQLPGTISPSIQNLVDSWTQRSRDPRQIAASALNFFRTGRFRYSLSPGEYGQDSGLDDFLFHRRTGFCEHYAAAFATLMRVAHVPSRVILGYQGGEFNTMGSYVVVRQSDAHAWCEIWKGTGWQRVDPTMAVSPDNANTAALSVASTAGATGIAGGQGAGVWSKYPLLRNIQLAWDMVSFEWDDHVSNFDEDAQQSFLINLGLVDTRPLRLFGGVILLAGILLGIHLLWNWFKMRPARDPLKTLYERFCKRTGALGVKREPWEGPSGFAARAAASLPAHAARIQRVVELYVALRYARDSGVAAAELEQEIKAFCK